MPTARASAEPVEERTPREAPPPEDEPDCPVTTRWHSGWTPYVLLHAPPQVWKQTNLWIDPGLPSNIMKQCIGEIIGRDPTTFRLLDAQHLQPVWSTMRWQDDHDAQQPEALPPHNKRRQIIACPCSLGSNS